MSLVKINSETPVAMCTVGQLVDFLSENGYLTKKEDIEGVLSDAMKGAAGNVVTEGDTTAKKTRYLYGLQGICEEFKVSKSKAQHLKKEVFPEAVMQEKRKIIVNAELAWSLYRKECKRQEMLKKNYGLANAS